MAAPPALTQAEPTADELAAWRQQAEAELSALPATRATDREAVAALGVVRALGTWPVHRGALRGDRRRRQPWPLDRAGAARVLRVAERLAGRPVAQRDVQRIDRLTGETSMVRRPIQYGGTLSPTDIKVLRAIMRFLDRKGRAHPGYKALARAAGLGLNTVKEACKYLRALQIIDWTQRCTGQVIDGVYRLVQDTNEYILRRPEEWLGYSEELEGRTPPPSPDTWGAADRIEAPTEEEKALSAALDSLRAARERFARDRGSG